MSIGFSRQEYWNGEPFPSPGDLPDPGIEPSSPAPAGEFFIPEPPGKPCLLSTSVCSKPSLNLLCSVMVMVPFLAHFTPVFGIS